MTAWKALLTGEDAARARQHVVDLAQALEPHIEADSPNPWLAATLALFYGYLYLDTQDERYEALADRCIDKAIEGTGESGLHFSLYGGFTGVGWVLEHLDSLVEEDGAGAEEVVAEAEAEDEEEGAEVDEALFAFLNIRPWKGDYDLIGGLVGIGVYFLERHPDEAGAEGLRRLLDHFEELAVETEDGLTILTAPELLPEWQRKIAPEGYYNLGLAHGVPGIVALLGHAITQGVDVERARRLLQGFSRWILAQRNSDKPGLWFQSWIAAGQEEASERRNGSRLAWCYNDLGLGTALYLAARGSGDGDLEAAALEILRQCAAVPVGEAAVSDVPLCHGSIGNAHIFNRIYQATGEAVFGEAARRWYQSAFEWHRPDRGIAGFQAYAPPVSEAGEVDNEQDPWKDDPSFLAGALGVGLAFLAAVSPVVPNWDRLLLIDIPPGGDF